MATKKQLESLGPSGLARRLSKWFAVAVACAFFATLVPLANELYIMVRYDDRPVQEIRKCVLESGPTVVPGGTITTRCQYDKRPKCVGSVEYRLLRDTPAGLEVSEIIGQFAAAWPSGRDRVYLQRIDIPQDTRRGTYTLHWYADYDYCASFGHEWGETSPSYTFRDVSPPIPLTVE